jgi:hypothetical protein
MTETERRLFLWFPMWAGRLLLLCYIKIPSPREDLARHAGCQPRCDALKIHQIKLRAKMFLFKALSSSKLVQP